METIKNQLNGLFAELDVRVEEMNRERRREDLLPISKARVQLLGQISLLVDERASLLLSLAQTGDIDAFLTMEHAVKDEFKKILRRQGLIYDEDSELIWIPPHAEFKTLFDLEHVLVESIDSESALVSKAVKAPGKNKQLIREAIASGAFATLADRILETGGKLENFI